MEYILIVLCLIGSAFFSGTEIAYTSLNKLKLRQDGENLSRTQKLVHFMSMENMMFNMYDYPELFKEMMDRIANDTLAYYRSKVKIDTT